MLAGQAPAACAQRQRVRPLGNTRSFTNENCPQQMIGSSWLGRRPNLNCAPGRGPTQYNFTKSTKYQTVNADLKTGFTRPAFLKDTAKINYF